MIWAAIVVLLWAGTATAHTTEIVCENLRVPRLITGNASRKVYVIEHQTSCYPVSDSELGELEKLKIACDLLVTAYGETDGPRRCRQLIERYDLDP
jgi:hypothetical protein